MNEKEDVVGKRRDNLLRHIDNVRNNCILLAEKLIDNGEVALGHQLMAKGYCHDQSKFHGIEWTYLNEEAREKCPDLFKAALLQHVSGNRHHPEAWAGGIKQMDRLHTAEMVCDWAARSSEFGKDLREWIKKEATKRFDFTLQSGIYKEIKGLVDMLLDKSF